MFKDIRVRAALRTLGLFGIAAVSGLVGVLFIQTYGIMAAVTLVAIGLVAAAMGRGQLAACPRPPNRSGRALASPGHVMAPGRVAGRTAQTARQTQNSFGRHTRRTRARRHCGPAHVAGPRLERFGQALGGHL